MSLADESTMMVVGSTAVDRRSCKNMVDGQLAGGEWSAQYLASEHLAMHT